jgi:hypothetical protein
MRTSLRAASRLGWSGASGGCGSSLSVSSRNSAAADLRRSQKSPLPASHPAARVRRSPLRAAMRACAGLGAHAV